MVHETRAAISWRAFAALAGGYVAASVLAITIAMALPIARADAVLFGTITSFAVYLAVVVILYARIRPGFRQSMAWLHSWTGLLLGWILYLVFVTGTAAYYRDEINMWMRPEAAALGAPADPVERGIEELQRQAPDAKRWVVQLPGERDPTFSIQWQSQRPAEAGGQLSWDARSQSFVAVRDTRGGSFLYRFHYSFDLDEIGEWIVGFATLIMCLAIVSGIITHRRIFKDFFTFRPGKAPSRAWLDIHNVTGVLALPFHVMISYTGLITLMFLYIPWAQTALYGDEAKRFSQEAYGNADAPVPAGRPARMADTAPMVAQVNARWGEGRIERLMVYNPGDAHAQVEFRPNYKGQVSLNHAKMVFSGTDGALIRDVQGFGPGVKTRGGLVGMHVARFAEPGLRALFFLCGLVGSGMIATGLILWIEKRRGKNAAQGSGFRIVERLNVGTILGVPIAIAAYFAANRLLPFDLAGRAEWEARAFVLTLLLAILFGFVRSPAKSWRDAMGLASAGFLSVPLLNALTTKRHMIASVARGDWLFVGFDAVMIAIGAVCAFTCVYLHRRRPRAVLGHVTPAIRRAP